MKAAEGYTIRLDECLLSICDAEAAEGEAGAATALEGDAGAAAADEEEAEAESEAADVLCRFAFDCLEEAEV